MFDRSTTVIQDRNLFIYRVLESSLAISTLGFIVLFVIISFFYPTLASIFLLIYALMWIFKILLNIQYTLKSFKNFRRYQDFDFHLILTNFSKKEFILNYLREKGNSFAKNLDWQDEINRDRELYLRLFDSADEVKFLKPYEINQIAVFSIYNESSEVLLKSLKCVCKTKWPYKKLFVTISQEARAGKEHNQNFIDSLKSVEWINLIEIEEYKQMKLENPEIKLQISETKLNVFITEHPDGLEGEIKGKASNETWGTKETLAILESEIDFDLDMTLATSLDADSHLTEYFFHNLAYRYILTADRYHSGFQPVHVYSNNFFEIGLFPRLVATQTTMYNLTNLSIADEGFFFAIYSVPAKVLKEVDFWVTDIIAEDSILFSKCLTHYNGNFRVIPHWGIFEGDAVEATDYIQEIINQYKQLQRWSWGGVEGFPYLFKRLWLTKESKNIKLKDKIKWTYLKFGNHFFWVTTPFIFSIGPFIPVYFHSQSFSSTPIAQNLSVMSQYFAWISFIFIGVFAYLTFNFQAKHAKKDEPLNKSDILTLIVQFVLSPSLFAFMAIPAIESQVRGLLGQYIGYWVTPKK
jgi:hypothetical protein